MRVGELARRTGVTIRALRYYEAAGLVVPARLPNGYRDYEPVAVRQVEEIRALHDLGCTPEACGFRDHHAELCEAGAGRVYGQSSQSGDYQRELVDRLHLPFAMLSDPEFTARATLGFPTFVANGIPLYRRLTMIIDNGSVEHVFYPVFPPDCHAEQVLDWHPRGSP